MYIPPEGALQFHVNEGVLANIGDIAVWVVPTKLAVGAVDRRINKCQIHPLYLVLIESFPPRIQEAYAELVRQFGGNTDIIVCECVGQVIE